MLLHEIWIKKAKSMRKVKAYPWYRYFLNRDKPELTESSPFSQISHNAVSKYANAILWHPAKKIRDEYYYIGKDIDNKKLTVNFLLWHIFFFLVNCACKSSTCHFAHNVFLFKPFIKTSWKWRIPKGTRIPVVFPSILFGLYPLHMSNHWDHGKSLL